MAKENIEKFEQLLVSNEALQKKFREATDTYTGDKQDEKAVFDAVVKPLAEEAGLPFTYEEVKDFVIKDGELSFDEADAVTGGDSYCFIVGGGDGTYVDDCNYQANEPESGGGACAYVGVGFFTWD